MNLLLLAAAFATGALIALQPGINAGLARVLPSPFQASLISFTTGTLALLAICATRGLSYPRPSALAGLPWWQVVGGGCIGALYVTLALSVAPRLGATLFLAAVLAGQMASSILVDQRGWLGFPREAAGLPKLAGAVLVLAGVLLIARR